MTESDDFSQILGSGLPKGTPARQAVNKAKGEVFGDDDDDEQKRRKRRREAASITRDFAPTGPNPFAINSGI